MESLHVSSHFLFFLSLSLSLFMSSMRKKEEREGDDIKRHVIINISIPWNFATSIATVIHLKFFLISESRVNNCKNIYFFEDIWCFISMDWRRLNFFFSFLPIYFLSSSIRSDPRDTDNYGGSNVWSVRSSVRRPNEKKEEGGEPYVQRSR